VLHELVIRFVVGGLIVSVFAVIGEVLAPKSFAGIFGAAPSVALATLGLTFASHPPSIVMTECRTMMIGAIGFIAYSSAAAAVVRRAGMPVWLGAGACWAVWLLVSFGLWELVRYASSGAV
jgi:hypothetical protein